ncbi:MAG TPA: trypsin-like peptidase domain-containing protein, partial [Acidimicrobiales bacterium]|nr:trypsin-like peptidase domain-containing protein [Acidimicrobiales bacterium]
VAGLFTQSSVSWLARPIQGSAVLTALDAVMPPVPTVIARAQAFLSSDVFPVAFAAVTSPTTTSVPVPSQRAADEIGARVARSVLEVVATGGCGERRTGTAFVVAPDLVITNAHVVAGETTIDVVTPDRSRAASLVVFDPALDVAVLRVAHLSLPVLALDTETVPHGAKGAVVGFPGGGPLTDEPAGVAGALVAQGRDVYGGSLVTRSIYAVTADVSLGNSGSPLVVGGRVAGMVFSRSVDYANLAYALQGSTLTPDLGVAERRVAPVASGACPPT